MNYRLLLLMAIVGVKPLSRSMRSFWVPSKNPLSNSKRSLRFGRRDVAYKRSFRAAVDARRHYVCVAQMRRGEGYRMSRRPLAGIAL